MKFSIVCVVFSLSSYAAAGVLRRTNPATPQKKNHPRDAVRVRGGDVIVLQGKGARDINNNIIIVDNSNESRKKKESNKNNDPPSGSGFANIVVIQGENTWTMVDGRINGQGNGVQTVTVTSTMTSIAGQQTNAPGAPSIGSTLVSSSPAALPTQPAGSPPPAVSPPPVISPSPVGSQPPAGSPPPAISPSLVGSQPPAGSQQPVATPAPAVVPAAGAPRAV